MGLSIERCRQHRNLSIETNGEVEDARRLQQCLNELHRALHNKVEDFIAVKLNINFVHHEVTNEILIHRTEHSGGEEKLLVSL